MKTHIGRWGLAVGILCCALFPSRSPSGQPPFAVGERLAYTISWASVLVAGEMTLSVRGRGRFFDRAGWRLELRAQTVGPVHTLIKAWEEQRISYVDPESWLPYRVDHMRREGDRRTDLTITLDQRRGIARLSTGRTIPIAPHTRDIVAFLYYVRTVDLSPGRRYRLEVLNESRRLLVEAEVREPAQVQTRAGHFQAIEVALRVQEKGRGFSDEPRVRLWLSADDRRVPVLITGRDVWGEVRVELTDIARDLSGGDRPSRLPAQRR